MSRQNLELLAPAGTPAVLKTVVEAGADAVYLGGKRFNMRLLRPEFNFSDEELRLAVKYLHEQQKKLYITVNNLYKQQELEEIKDYLLFLSELQVDALIIQDLGLIQLCQEMKINVPLHASVQMGINNLESVKTLEENGVSRVILSKNMSLQEIQEIHAGSGIGIEFFAHGDLCVSHTGQCLLSSFIFGESGNRGRCRKPCRWPYQLTGLDKFENTKSQYYLAHKDLCLYPHLAELIDAGVESFKIEGRMRSGEQLKHIITTYRQALDAYLDDPQRNLHAAESMQDLYDKRIRDFSSGSLFRPSHYEDIGLSGEREPVFPTAAVPLKHLNRIEGQLDKNPVRPNRNPEITVSAGNMESLQAILELGADHIILGLDNMRQTSMNWNPVSIKLALEIAAGSRSKILLETPRIVSQQDLAEIHGLTDLAGLESLYGFIVNDLGSLRILRQTGLPLWTGYGLNISNIYAAAFLKKLGVERITAALEMKYDDLQVLLAEGVLMELLVQGPLQGMITDLCIISSVTAADREGCARECANQALALQDEFGQVYRLCTDQKCRNYLYHPYERCLYHDLPRLLSAGLRSVRIDGQFYTVDQLKQVYTIYQRVLQMPQDKPWSSQADFEKLLGLFPDGLTAMPLFDAS